MSIVGGKKICCHCNEEKPLEQFYRRAASKDGYRPRCKACSEHENKYVRAGNKTVTYDCGWLYR